ncbi:neuroligin [Mytilus galloprovincialis]|uniref:Neuroligin n=1 Tax=Mytilus galloprovincialis TaxID=29158 RepID=A0A8B6HIM0_MYTGA|nr:neuroligin [Mytilus galloprovincialis]
MMHAITIILSALVLCSGLDNNPIRNTKYGKIRGRVTTRLPGTEVEEFLGVPYAAPPIKALRFKRPTDPTQWDGIKNTTRVPPACPQASWFYLSTHKPNFQFSNEDCLFMNIFVPRVKEKSLPVLLYIHGGSNRVGMGAMFDGDILSAYGKIVVVNFNYRLGVLGFYADRSKGIEGNLGLLDQVKAMEWVQKNIHFFNGDPTKVTIHGHSAGAGNVGLHLVSDLTKGLFRYAIVHSGSPLAFWGVSDCIPTMKNKTVAEDCQQGSSHLVESLKSEDPMSEPVNTHFLTSTGEKTPFNLVPFRPVLDGHYLTDIPDKMFQCNQVHAESVLMAMAKDEFFPKYSDTKYQRASDEHFDFDGLFTEDEADTIEKVYEEWKKNNISQYPHYAQMGSDLIFFAPMVKLADLISEWMKRVYMLSFEYVSQNLTGPQWQGIPHGWDLFYVFGAPLVGHSHHVYTPRDVQVSKTTMKLFSNYVKYGYLSVDGKHQLDIYNSTTKSFYKLHYQNGKPVVSAEYNFRKPRIDFWNKYLFSKEPFTCNEACYVDLRIHFCICCLIAVYLFN